MVLKRGPSCRGPSLLRLPDYGGEHSFRETLSSDRYLHQAYPYRAARIPFPSETSLIAVIIYPCR